MCARIKGHWYCVRVTDTRTYYVHSCKTRRSKHHKKAAHWFPRESPPVFIDGERIV
jgi:hypothetical protein